jgi:hypothetical protein
MSATLKLTHKAIGAEVRRTYDVVVDGERVGSVEMNHTIEIPVEPGRHTLQVRNGRNSSSTQTFDAAEEEIVAVRCTGKRLLPIILYHAQAGTETRSRLSRRRRRGAHQHVVIAVGVSLSARDKTLAGRGQAPLPASPGATGSTA